MNCLGGLGLKGITDFKMVLGLGSSSGFPCPRFRLVGQWELGATTLTAQFHNKARCQAVYGRDSSSVEG